MEKVIPYIPKAALIDLAKCLKWNPVIVTESSDCKMLEGATADEQQSWLDKNRDRFYDEIKKSGRSRWGNFWDTDSRVGHRESVCEVAKALDVEYSSWHAVDAIETKIVEALSRKIMANMTPEQKEQWLSKVRDEAEKHGIHVGVELAGLGAIGAAQMAGFGLYIFASTVLGAINGALGLGLGFGVFMGVSKLIALAIGPLGAAIFIVPLVIKARSADPKKLLPIVAYIAAYRNHRQVRFADACQRRDVDGALKLIAEMDHKGGAPALLAMCEEQPESRRAVPFHVVRFLAEAMQGRVNTDCLDAVQQSDLTAAERDEVAKEMIKHIERLVPGILDDVLCAFILWNFCSVRLCYLHAPEGGESEISCVMAIIESIAGALAQSARSVTA